MTEHTSPESPKETGSGQVLELADIQGTVLRQRLSPYTGAYFLLRIDDAADGRAMIRRLAPQVATATDWWDPPLEPGSMWR